MAAKSTKKKPQMNVRDLKAKKDVKGGFTPIRRRGAGGVEPATARLKHL